jgi:hypothetical protein
MCGYKTEESNFEWGHCDIMNIRHKFSPECQNFVPDNEDARKRHLDDIAKVNQHAR